MIGIGPEAVTLIGLLIFVAFLGGVFYFAFMVIKRLSEISLGIRNIEEKQTGNRSPVSPPPSREQSE